jgi:hypothetical protein
MVQQKLTQDAILCVMTDMCHLPQPLILLALILCLEMIFYKMKTFCCRSFPLLLLIAASISIPYGRAFSSNLNTRRHANIRSSILHSAEPSSGLPEIPFVTKTVGKRSVFIYYLLEKKKTSALRISNQFLTKHLYCTYFFFTRVGSIQ